MKPGHRPIRDLLTWAFATLWIGLNVGVHALWLDEAHAWCLVRDSVSLTDFAANMANEGHPWLWHAMLFPLAHLGAPAWSMQVLHAVIASATCALIVYRAPFPYIVRLLLVCGYFLVFEYAALSRNYAIGVLLLLLAADLVHRGRKGVGYTVVLVLLAQTHLWAASVVAVWALLAAAFPGDRPPVGRTILVLLSCSIAFLAILPQDQVAYAPDASRLMESAPWEALGRQLTKVFVPIPDGQALQPWNTSLLTRNEGPVANWTGYLIWLVLVLILPLSARGRIRFVAGSLAVMAFPLLAPFEAIRYAGPVLLLAVAVCWSDPGKAWLHLPRLAPATILTLLLVQVVAVVRISWMCIERPFSMASQVSLAIEAGPDLPVVVAGYDAGASLSAYLGRPVHFPERGAFGSFCIWYPRPFDPTGEQIGQAVLTHADTGCFLVTDPGETPPTLPEGLHPTHVGTFAGGMLAGEDHAVFLLRSVP